MCRYSFLKKIFFVPNFIQVRTIIYNALFFERISRLRILTSNFSLFRTIIYNALLLKGISCIKLFAGRGTSISLEKGASLIVCGSLYFDCRNAGQFFYNSHVFLQKDAIFETGEGTINFFGGAEIKCFENSHLEIGGGTYFSGPIVIQCKNRIIIGRNCSIAWGVTVLDSDLHPVGTKEMQLYETVIEDGVWIGCNVTVLKGVRIGEGAVVGAGSVVSRDVEPYSIVAGNPAQFIRYLNQC